MAYGFFTMISKLHGIIEEINDTSLVLGVGGVGYEVYCLKRARTTLSTKIGEELTIYTHYHLRENAAELYGFLDKAEREMFVILIGISGIGPKGALNILNVSSTNVLKRAIAQGDTSILTKVSGIGERIAQKIILELKDKFSEWGALPGDIRGEVDVVDAVHSLGYSRRDAQQALREVPDTVEKMEDKIREVLKILGGNK